MSAKYNWLDACYQQEKCYNHDGAPKYEIQRPDFISHILFWVIDPGTWPLTWSKSVISLKHNFSSSVSGLTLSPSSSVLSSLWQDLKLTFINLSCYIIKWLSSAVNISSCASFICSWLKSNKWKCGSFWNRCHNTSTDVAYASCWRLYLCQSGLYLLTIREQPSA